MRNRMCASPHCLLPISKIGTMQVIARLDGLHVLNATPVTVHERRDSELQYVRSVLGEHPLHAWRPLRKVPAAPPQRSTTDGCPCRILSGQALASAWLISSQ